MLPPIAYLEFASRWYGQVAFDLATSGIAAVGPETLGGAAPPHDFAARDRFRERLAERYRVPAAQVVPTLGASGALFVAYAALARPKARVLVESPGYEPLWRVAEGQGLAVDRFERRFEDGFALEPRAVLGALHRDTRVVAVTNPHNPTGVVADAGSISALAAALAERGVSLLVDEAYLELASPGTTAFGLGPNVIACSSATKCWGVPWARAGWLFVPATLLDDAAVIEKHVAGVAPPSCWAWGERAVARASALLDRARGLQAGKRALVDRFVAEHGAVLSWVAPPETAVFGWLRDARDVDYVPKITSSIREHGVVVAPGEFFGEKSAFRLGWTGDARKLGAGLAELGKALTLVAAP